MSKGKDPIRELVKTVHYLRAPGGCPWDRAQTHQSLRPYLIEEAYEVLDVLDQVKSKSALKNPAIKKNLIEELGDLWMQVILHSEMAHEAKAFSLDDVARALNDKLIRRHPHVFGNVKAKSADAAYKSWEKQKALEKHNGKGRPNLSKSVLDGIPKNLPALQKTARIIDKTSRVGFQWPDFRGPLKKVREELDELERELRKKNNKTRVSDELGDLIFALCNLAAMLNLNPEDSLRSTLGRFQDRFRHVETELRKRGKTPDESNLKEMDALWNQAKRKARL